MRMPNTILKLNENVLSTEMENLKLPIGLSGKTAINAKRKLVIKSCLPIRSLQ